MPGLTRVRQNLRTIMESRGISIRRLAEQIDMSYPYISELLNGHKSIKVEQLERLADGLNVDIRDFFDDPKPAKIST